MLLAGPSSALAPALRRQLQYHSIPVKCDLQGGRNSVGSRHWPKSPSLAGAGVLALLAYQSPFTSQTSILSEPVYHVDNLVELIPTSLQAGGPMDELIRQHVGDFQPEEQDQLLKTAISDRQNFSDLDRKRFNEYLHMFSRILVYRHDLARPTTQLCIQHIERVLAVEREDNKRDIRKAGAALQRAQAMKHNQARVAVWNLRCLCFKHSLYSQPLVPFAAPAAACGVNTDCRSSLPRLR